MRERVIGCWCCRHSSGIKHFNIERTPKTFYLKDIQFTTIDQLVHYYSRTDVPNKELIRGVRLRIPITRAAPIGGWHLGNMSPEDDGDTGADVYIHPVCISLIRFRISFCYCYENLEFWYNEKLQKIELMLNYFCFGIHLIPDKIIFYFLIISK